jgi:8-oxo-dGTP pyrophosphatase MutT (NUDIX family)
MTDVALALMRRGDRWFLQRRDPANPVLPSLWEFPGGKVEAGETPAEALGRELIEEVDLALTASAPWPVIEGTVRLHPFLFEAAGNPRTDLAWGWFTVAEMSRLPIPPMNAALIGLLARGGGGAARPHPSDLIG